MGFYEGDELGGEMEVAAACAGVVGACELGCGGAVLETFHYCGHVEMVLGVGWSFFGCGCWDCGGAL